MRNYEMVYVIQADLDEATLNGVIDRVSDTIKNLGGEISKTDRWGKRKLAYPIQKMLEGFYVLLHYTLDPSQDAELRRVLKYNEQILRSIVMVLD